MVILRWFQNLRPKLKKILLQIKQKKKKRQTRDSESHWQKEFKTPRQIKSWRFWDQSKIFRDSVFPSIILYPLFYCGVSREVSILMCSITTIIIIIMGKQGTVNSLPPAYFQCTNLPTPAYITTSLPWSLHPSLLPITPVFLPTNLPHLLLWVPQPERGSKVFKV